MEIPLGGKLRGEEFKLIHVSMDRGVSIFSRTYKTGNQETILEGVKKPCFARRLCYALLKLKLFRANHAYTSKFFLVFFF